MKAFFRKLGWLAQRRRQEDELREELEFHLSEEAEERQAEGMAERESRWAARRELGNLASVQEHTREAWGWTIGGQFAQDLRYAWRMMGASKLFTTLTVLSLALGIGANTAIYSFMDAILLRALPVHDPGSLVVVNWRAKTSGRGDLAMHQMSGSAWRDGTSGLKSGMLPFAAFELFRKHDDLFSSVFGYYQPHMAKKLTLALNGRADVGTGQTVTGEYFRGLAVPPASGRLIGPEDDRPGAAPVVVVSHAFSESHFGGADRAAGQRMLINNEAFTVVGVTAPGFFGVDPADAPDLFVPMHANELLGAADAFGFRASQYLDANYYWIQAMARLRPGVSLPQAQAALAPEFAQWAATTAANDRERANLPQLVLSPGAGGLDGLRREYSRPLFVLMTMVGLILALACANVANLLLARSAARSREMALRLSVGAGRLRVVRQLLTESILLASMGGAVGLLFAMWGIRFLTALLAGGQDHFTVRAELNWHVLGTAAALSLLTGIVFGLAPALKATRVDLIAALKETRAGNQRAKQGWRRIGPSEVLVVGQIAISLLLLVAAGLFMRTLTNLQAVELGFNRENVLLFQLDARKAGHKDPEIAAFYGELRRRFSAIPGVREASLSDSSLIDAGFALDIGPAGKPISPATRLMNAGPEFLTTMQIPILAGRDLRESDHAGAPGAAVINEEFARVNFGNANPLGQHLTLRDNDRVARDMEIVGVSRNARYGGLKDGIPPVVYIAYDQGYPAPNEMVYALRTEGNPLRYAGAVREIARQADARVPVSDIKTQAANVDENINEEITLARLCTGFAVLALAIACVGLYGTVSYNVARRTGEIGIRMALGARGGDVVWMILRWVCGLAAAGLGIAVPAALGASRYVESFLFGMKHNDPAALTVAVATLVLAALVAGYLPARRAARIDPMNALRHD